MTININKKNFDYKIFYEKKEIEGLNNAWKVKASKSKQARKTSQGREYEVYTKKITHGFAWKLVRKITVCVLIIFTLNRSKKIPSLRQEAQTGVEVRKIKILCDLSVNEKKVEQVGQAKIIPQKQTLNSSSQSSTSAQTPIPPSELNTSASKPVQIPVSHSSEPHTSDSTSQLTSEPLLHANEENAHQSTFTKQNLTTSSHVVVTPIENSLPDSQISKQIAEIEAKAAQFPSILTLKIQEPGLEQSSGIFTKEHDHYHNRLQLVMEANLLHMRNKDDQAKNLWSLIGARKGDEINAFKKRFSDRFDLYNKAIQLEDRLAVLEPLSYIQGLQVRDIEVPWEESGLRIALLTKKEVAALTFEQISTLSERQLEILLLRVQDVEPITGEGLTILLKQVGQKAANTVVLTHDQLKSMKLEDIRSLSSSAFQQTIGYFEGKKLFLLTEEQRDNLQMELLYDDQFYLIYIEDVNKLNKLISPKLEDWILRVIQIDPAYLGSLSESKIKSIDFTDPRMIKKEILDGLAKIVSGTSKKKEAEFVT